MTRKTIRARHRYGRRRGGGRGAAMSRFYRNGLPPRFDPFALPDGGLRMIPLV